MRVAKVAVEQTAYHFDKAYDYQIPSELCGAAQEGCRVLVPFGGGNRQRQGMIMRIGMELPAQPIKSIGAVLDQAPLLHRELLQLAQWMKNRYFCTLFDAIRAMLPAGIHYRLEASYQLAADIPPEVLQGLSAEERRLVEYLAKSREPVRRERLLKAMGLEKECALPEQLAARSIVCKSDGAVRRIGDAAIRMLRLSAGQEEGCSIKLTPKQQEVYTLLQSAGCASVKEVCYFTGVTTAVVNSLIKKGVAEYFEQEMYRSPEASTIFSADASKQIVLTQEQQQAFDALCAQYRRGQAGVSLLYGVTGSGKTSVFMRLIDEVSKQGLGVIVMVPEISLTPQMLSLFQARYGKQVAVFHSALSMGERLDEWKRVRNGEARIAVGTRSAVFAPFARLGLIIMDEEQEYTYKSESSPRFHARDVAKFRCQAHGCMLLLSSATPAVESFYAAQQGRYSLNRLSARYGGAQLPEVTIADMNLEMMEGNTGLFSSVLLENLAENLRMKKQSILLLNRRGYHTFVSCRACGEVLTCPNCSISMTYHSANQRLMCHYCGYSVAFTDECPSCHEHQMRYGGMGTQRAQESLESLMPEARILRMDTDTTMTRYAYEHKLQQFAEGQYDIMVGTQMVAKGLNFPNVTLVGVLSADQALYSDDFRSYERAFALLTQVVGRSGRGGAKGRAIIQTFTPENPIIRLAASQNYEAFYRSEIQMRKAMLYPPFVDICVVGFVGNQEQKTAQAAARFFQLLTNLAKEEYSRLPLRILGPSSASIAKVSNKYRYKLIIKFRNDQSFREMLSRTLTAFGKQREFAEVTAFADVNPDMIL